MDFGRALAGSIESLDLDLCMQTGANGVLLLEKTEEAKKAAAMITIDVHSYFFVLPADKSRTTEANTAPTPA